MAFSASFVTHKIVPLLALICKPFSAYSIFWARRFATPGSCFVTWVTAYTPDAQYFALTPGGPYVTPNFSGNHP